ncbi:hypothetical protein ABMX86_21430 [Vibrio vulnificus]|uniref:hypothetical protein n=1 Tax=Vibrio TaxID=662 RepID=UPI0015946F66|nr:hypothetical protein [Vibrio aestuarianus]MDE1334106.1 hypothetical protein [Vibrio aestuarianus]NGZ19405.1 hypothetical protein [Vibrio aestuarianus]
MNALKKIVKLIVSLIVLLVVVIGCWLGYMKYEQMQREKAELTFLTDREWTWYDKYDRIQSNHIPILNVTMLRKVNLKQQYVIYASKNQDYTLSARVVFAVECEPETSIVTSKTFSDGTPKELKCNSDGKSLSYGVKWTSASSDVVWSEDLDGFKVYENFGNWDFSVLDKEITLSKAK